MNVAEARAIWDETTRRGEGYLDAMARAEEEHRLLTPAEIAAADVLWHEFIAAMEQMAEAWPRSTPR